MERFLAVEERFVGRADTDAATRELVKAAPRPEAAAVLLAHAKLGDRAALVRALIAALPRVQALPGRATEDEAARLEKCLERVAALEAAGPAYATAALSAGMARLEADVPPFDKRLDALRKDLAKTKDLTAFASNPQLGSYTRGVDILTSLFDDADETVALKAAEAYVRRMYSAHDIFELTVGKNAAGVLEASWWYKYRSDDTSKAPLRFGKLALFDDAASAVAGLSATIERYGDELRAGLAAHADWQADPEDETPVNTIHLLLKTPENELQDKDLISTLESALAGVQNAVEAASLRSVSFIATDAP